MQTTLDAATTLKQESNRDWPRSLHCPDRGDGHRVVEAELEPGLYALTVEADARQFAWEDLYIVFNWYGNKDQRTGPWDFNETQDNRPVMPAYWVVLDGRRLGLWYFNRLSVEQVAQQRCRGELGFRITHPGRHRLEFIPYRPFAIEWTQVHLLPEPHDRLQPMDDLPSDLIGRLLPPVMPDNRFTQGFRDSVAFAKQQVNTKRNSGFQLPILAAAWRWTGDAEASAAARQVIQRYLDLPVWGNPREDGYGHNGDMAAATPLFGMAVALRWMGDELADLRPRILAKLEKQGDTFLEMAWLHRGYWGGSILQDHGFVSFAWFACAAYCLHDILPAARHWLAFAVPRMQRTLAAMPRDGVVPATSYHRIWMYVDKLVLFRELHLLATGHDIHQHEAIRAIPRAARACFVPQRLAFAFPSSRGDFTLFDGAQAFLAQLAQDDDAAWLLDQFFADENLHRARPPYNEWHFQKDWLWALLFAQSRQPVDPQKSSFTNVKAETHWFKDSGVGVVRAAASLLVAHCGPPCSGTSYEHATCVCDRMVLAPLDGSFVYVHEGRRVLHTAEGDYRQGTEVGNMLLVDGHGQRGDIGMPMSYPDFKYHGQRILDVSETTVEMDLAPAYRGLHRYTRSVALEATGALWLQDIVVPASRRTLCWRFQTYQCNLWLPLRRGVWQLSVDDHPYHVAVSVDGADYDDRIEQTLTVWGYVNDNDDQWCHHLAVIVSPQTEPVALRLHITPLQLPVAASLGI